MDSKISRFTDQALPVLITIVTFLRASVAHIHIGVIPHGVVSIHTAGAITTMLAYGTVDSGARFTFLLQKSEIVTCLTTSASILSAEPAMRIDARLTSIDRGEIVRVLALLADVIGAG